MNRHTPSRVTPVRVGLDAAAGGQSHQSQGNGGVSPLGMKSAYSSLKTPTTSSHSPKSHTTAGSPESWGPRRVVANPSAVTSAFREMQEKARLMEEETELRKMECFDIREKIAGYERVRTEHSSARGEEQLRNTETLFSLRASQNNIRKQVAEMDAQLLSIDNDSRTIQMDITHSRQQHAAIEDDLLQLRAGVLRLDSLNEDHQREFDECFTKTEGLQMELDPIPTQNHMLQRRLQHVLNETEQENSQLTWQMSQQENQFQTVARYMQMLVELNDEICTAVLAREEARARVLRLSGRLHLPYDPYSISGGASERNVTVPSLRSGAATDFVDEEGGSVVHVRELATRARQLCVNLAEAKSSPLNQWPEPTDTEHDDDADAGAAFQQATSLSEDEARDERKDEADRFEAAAFIHENQQERKSGKREDNTFTNVMSGVARQASQHGLKSQARVAKKNARILSSAASRSTAVKIHGSVLSSAKRSSGSGSGNRSSSAPAAAPSTRMRQRRAERGQTAKKSYTHIDMSGTSPREVSSPSGSPSANFGSALHPSYGYETAVAAGRAFVSAAGAAARRRDDAEPLLKASNYQAAHSKLHERQVRNGFEDEQQNLQSTYRQAPKPAQPHAGAWMPGGAKNDPRSPSNNIIANKNKVYRSAKIGLSRAPLNHYNKLHIKQLKL